MLSSERLDDVGKNRRQGRFGSVVEVDVEPEVDPRNGISGPHPSEAFAK